MKNLWLPDIILFSDSDWDDFYNFGFGCVKEYLRDDSVESPRNKYDLKATKTSIEGIDGDETLLYELDLR